MQATPNAGQPHIERTSITLALWHATAGGWRAVRNSFRREVWGY